MSGGGMGATGDMQRLWSLMRDPASFDVRITDSEKMICRGKMPTAVGGPSHWGLDLEMSL